MADGADAAPPRTPGAADPFLRSRLPRRGSAAEKLGADADARRGFRLPRDGAGRGRRELLGLCQRAGSAAQRARFRSRRGGAADLLAAAERRALSISRRGGRPAMKRFSLMIALLFALALAGSALAQVDASRDLLGANLFPP